jgi:hypothetical protein
VELLLLTSLLEIEEGIKEEDVLGEVERGA